MDDVFSWEKRKMKKEQPKLQEILSSAISKGVQFFSEDYVPGGVLARVDKYWETKTPKTHRASLKRRTPNKNIPHGGIFGRVDFS